MILSKIGPGFKVCVGVNVCHHYCLKIETCLTANRSLPLLQRLINLAS